jgi:two-component system phosphate regulon sensor histidine kinase PhoR
MKDKNTYRKQNFSGIIILMGISLLGVIFIQLLWMKKAINVKEEQFDQQINKLLSNVALRIERNQNALMLSHLAQQKSVVPTNGNIEFYGSVKDSLIHSFNNYWTKKAPAKKIPGNIRVKKDGINGPSTIEMGFDTLIQSGNNSHRIQAYSSVTTNSEDIYFIDKQNKINLSTTIDEVKNELNEVVEQMVLEFSIKDIPLEEKISLSTIGPTIKHELKNFEIPLDFEFAIADKNYTIHEKLRSKGFREKDTKKAYKTWLFPNQISFGSEKLMVVFPDKRGFIYHSLVWLFVGSLAFTLIILATFYYAIRFLVTQKKVSEVKTDFINNMTHEFKTPIATISLATDSINNPKILNDPSKVTRFTQIIREENQRMNRQVESVLKMAMIDKKDFNLSMTSMNVHQKIEKAVENIKLQVEQKGGTITIDLQAENDKLRVDETHFTNIIFNLLDNANKYSLNAPPQIKVTTYNMNDSMYIAIEDKGIGMDKETQNKIFDKFYRYNTGNVHTVKGFGLGLSYVKAIVMAFKGSIEVKSQRDKGSTFTLRIPALKY